MNISVTYTAAQMISYLHINDLFTCCV